MYYVALTQTFLLHFKLVIVMWVWLISERKGVAVAADDIFISHAKRNLHTKFGAFVRRVTISWFFALKLLYTF